MDRRAPSSTPRPERDAKPAHSKRARAARSQGHERPRFNKQCTRTDGRTRRTPLASSPARQWASSASPVAGGIHGECACARRSRWRGPARHHARSARSHLYRGRAKPHRTLLRHRHEETVLATKRTTHRSTFGRSCTQVEMRRPDQTSTTSGAAGRLVKEERGREEKCQEKESAKKSSKPYIGCRRVPTERVDGKSRW